MDASKNEIKIVLLTNGLHFVDVAEELIGIPCGKADSSSHGGGGRGGGLEGERSHSADARVVAVLRPMHRRITDSCGQGMDY